LNEAAFWQREDGERKGEMIDPAAGVYAEIETGPTEFGGRRRFKNRGLRFGRQIGAARRASRESPEQYEPRNETPAMAPASGSFGGQLQSGAAAHAFVSIVQDLLANGDLESRLRKYQQSFEKRKPNRCCKMATPLLYPYLSSSSISAYFY
jgi:hypothetical protein